MKEFIDYVLSFYGQGEIYDIGATRDEAWQALCISFREKRSFPFCGDSVDRELIRDLILAGRG